MRKIITFGEIMLRLSPSILGERLTQANQFRIEPGGSEANVAIALSNLGMETSFISALPTNALSERIIQEFNKYRVDSQDVVYRGNKLGIYWTETGVGPRSSYVIYDRDNTAFSEIEIIDFNWDKIFDNGDWFHFSGISPAISSNVYEVLLDAVSKISIPYSVDLNYRSKLWNWVDKDSKSIGEYMTLLCDKATLIGGNESDFQNIFNLKTSFTKQEDSFYEISRMCFEKFPQLKYISISNRDSKSASSNNWNGFLFVKKSNEKIESYESIKYQLEPIVDRVGTGDSFISGIIYGLVNKSEFTYKEIVDFASTLSALNHTTLGDASNFSIKDVLGVLQSKGNGRILR